MRNDTDTGACVWSPPLPPAHLSTDDLEALRALCPADRFDSIVTGLHHAAATYRHYVYPPISAEMQGRTIKEWRRKVQRLTHSAEALAAGLLRNDPDLDTVEYLMPGVVDNLLRARLRRKFIAVAAIALANLPPPEQATTRTLKTLPVPLWPLEILSRRLGADGLAHLRALLLAQAPAQSSQGHPAHEARTGMLFRIADLLVRNGLQPPARGIYKAGVLAVLRAVEGDTKVADCYSPDQLQKICDKVLAEWRQARAVAPAPPGRPRQS